LTDEELDRREQAVRHLAQVHVDQGKLDVALEAARQSMRMASVLAARDPGKASWQAHLAEARGLVGYVLYSQESSLAEARSMMESGRDIYLRLVAAHPDDPQWKKALVAAYLNVGAVCETVGDVAAALTAQRAAVDLARLLLEELPQDRTVEANLADALGFYSTSLEQSGDLRGAVEAREANLRILARKLARDPKDAGTRNDLSVAHSYAAGLLIGRGDLAAAERHQRESLALGEELAAADPENATWRANTATTRSNLGTILLEEGRPAEALPMLESVVRTFAPLHAENPGSGEASRHLAAGYTRRGRIFAVLGRADEARRDFERAQELYAALVAANPGGTVAVRFAELGVARGELEERAGDHAAARARWEEALQRLPPLGQRADHRSLTLRARLLLYLGRPAKAKPLLERLQAMGGYSESLFALAKREGVEVAAPR
jgi:tetratricopeptide (TPR) repeat protein